MACGLRAAYGAEDPAVFADDIRHALDQPEDDQVRDPDVVQAADPQVRIEQQIERKGLPDPELAMGLFGIRADAKNDGLFPGEFVGEVAEPARLGGSPGRGVLWEEIQDNSFQAEKMFQPYLFAILVQRRKKRRRRPGLQHWASPPRQRYHHG